ncbi:MAG: RagB/SusD family nutrient uptake outer membrane protein [Bacteroidales bacterium]|nr:RagB/SusD family nutrient uptake outer membrane protein [Bacteroidales bacterium]
MKNWIIYLIIVSTSISCSDSFLETENKNNLESSSLLTNETGLKLAVNAAYTPLAHSGMFGLQYFKMLNALDPYIWFENPETGFDVMAYSATDFDLQSYISTWSDLYIGVFRTSDVISKMKPLESTIGTENFNIYQAQLKALRGMYYFYLVTWFNKPPYYDETNIQTDANEPFKNGTPEQFWNKIESDLNFAAEHLPASWGDNDLGRITKGAAYAQLGKALLYKHYHYYLRFNKPQDETKANLLKAKQALKKVIDSGDYELIKPVIKNKKNYEAALLSNSSYVDIPVGNVTYRAENNKESVWEVQYNDDDRTSTAYNPGSTWGGNLLYAYFSPRGYRNFEIDPSLWYEFETVSGHPGGYTRDPRAYATCYLDGDTLDWRKESGFNIPFSSNAHTKTTVKLYNLYSGVSPSVAIGLKKYNYPQFYEKGTTLSAPFNVRVIRYADVLLMYSEACYQYDRDADGSGLAALNLVRTRVDMPVVTDLTSQAIIHERNVELATEGHRFNDIVRWSFDSNLNIDLATLFNNRFNVNKHCYFPIPQSEISISRGFLVQNPNW